MKFKNFCRSHRKKIILGAPIIFLFLLDTTGVIGVGNIFFFTAENTAFVSVGDNLPIHLEMSTKVGVNAAGGTVIFSPDVLSADSITRTTSVIDLWAEEPMISNTDGTIHFSGGIIGAKAQAETHGTVFAINFRARKPGKTTLSLKDGQLLASNGAGTNVFSGMSTLTIYVREQGKPSPDINGDGMLSISDINSLYLKTFRAYDKQYDINGDGKVDWSDVKSLIGLL